MQFFYPNIHNAAITNTQPVRNRIRIPQPTTHTTTYYYKTDSSILLMHIQEVLA